MDILPSLPNRDDQRLLLAQHNHDLNWADTAIAITDNEKDNYHVISPDWHRSNPKGYAEWFRTKMAVVFEERRRVLAEKAQASVEEIPDFRVRTPLQSAIMILKHHRDNMFVDDAENKPISIIITTLAAHSYGGERSTAEALITILERLENEIKVDAKGHYKICNPVDPTENFADKWEKYPERRIAFFRWLDQARRDFRLAATLNEAKPIQEALQHRLGNVAEQAASRVSDAPTSTLRSSTVAPVASAAGIPSFGDQRRAPTKPQGFA